ncbi:unnamed protein product [Urochloa decumbens]|uniref:Uncharacterized protein n=1 Tax=Urochloa decumbens TaxID=240449 RepID=A0ABC9B6G0_9POAL
MDRMLEHPVRGNENLCVGRSVSMTTEGKAISIGSVAMRAEGRTVSRSLAEIGEEKTPRRSWGPNLDQEEEITEAVRAEERSSCSSWVVEMKKLLEDTNPPVEMVRWKRRCIYRVPEYIKKETNSDAYRPQFVSLGPLHHGEPHLQPMEVHKRRAMLHLVKWTGKPIEQFITAIEDVVDELQDAYDDLDDEWRGEKKGRFVEMMVTDGCFLLELMRIDPTKEHTGYEANDPVFSRRSYLNLWRAIRDDMIAMENQVPLVVLQRILAQFSTSLSARRINFGVQLLLNMYVEEGMDNLGLHFLDIYHRSYCGTTPTPFSKQPVKYEPRTLSAVELSEAGIEFKKSNGDGIHDLEFENSVLSMPLLKFYDETEKILLNLMAFERQNPDAEYHLASYISFVDKIIESERDVALLRSKGIILNMTGSDKKVAEMFNTLTKLAKTPAIGSKLGHVQYELNDHWRKRRNKWRASFMNNYLSSPWMFISLVAAVVLLAATLLQTVYAIVPFYTKG